MSDLSLQIQRLNIIDRCSCSISDLWTKRWFFFIAVFFSFFFLPSGNWGEVGESHWSCGLDESPMLERSLSPKKLTESRSTEGSGDTRPACGEQKKKKENCENSRNQEDGTPSRTGVPNRWVATPSEEWRGWWCWGFHLSVKRECVFIIA